MPRLSRFSIAKEDIIFYFENLLSKSFTKKDIALILDNNRQNWRLTKSMYLDEFLEEMLSKTKLKLIEIEFPNFKAIRYIYGYASAYDLSLTLKPNAYFSHYTAIYHHGLTEQIPKALYTTFEQSEKEHKEANLIQERIDSAFSKLQRFTENHADYDGYTIHLLNGKFTNNEGIITSENEQMGKIRVTSLERTLIDIAVRPAYSGGVGEVIKAYERAKETVSVNKLNAMLKKLKFIYPYHQAIGFYMEKAGYRDAQLNLMKAHPFEFDFYLTYGMKDKDYSPTWRLYYPKGL